MRSILMMLLLIALMLSIGCGSSTNQEPIATPGPELTEAVAFGLAEEYFNLKFRETARIDLWQRCGSTNWKSFLCSKEPEGTWVDGIWTFPIWYVSDDDKYDIDEDAILNSVKEGNKIANKERIENGFSPLYVKGWYSKPYYDNKTNNLTWAILAESDGEPVVNHNIRFLGRFGVMSVVLATDPNSLDNAIRETEPILSTFAYEQGNRYFEWVKGDKIANYGLTALIAGGAGAAAAKLGLFAKLGKFLIKIWYLVVAAIIGIFNVIKGFFAKTIKGE